MAYNSDRTKTSFVEQKSDKTVTEQRIGKVSRVYEHEETNDNSDFEADVIIDVDADGQNGRVERAAPIASKTSNRMDVPRVGDSVIVGFRAGEGVNPVIQGFINTTKDRPPIGKAGMSREKLESGKTPLGKGDVYITKYTDYDGNPSENDTSTMSPKNVTARIIKTNDVNTKPKQDSNPPAKIEFYESRTDKGDEGHVSVELNKVDGDDPAAGSDTTWGFKLNFKTGAVKLVDPHGTGLVSDGEGHWTWAYKSKDENEIILESDYGNLSL